MEKKLGIVFWNTLYRASPQRQLSHIMLLGSQLEAEGADEIVFCLSEVTQSKSGGNDLSGTLKNSGFKIWYEPVGEPKGSNYTEGLCIASPQDASTGIEYLGSDILGVHKAISGNKQRRVQRVALQLGQSTMEICSVTMSYLAPPKAERHELTRLMQADNEINQRKIIVGGDFNTVLSKRVIKDLAAEGFTELRDTKTRATVPVLCTKMGSRLDHVLNSPAVSRDHNVSMKVGEKGPSNHAPLLVMVEG